MNADETAAALRRHYLSLPGRTEQGWQEVIYDPRKFNRLWNHYLHRQPSDAPPAEALHAKPRDPRP